MIAQRLQAALIAVLAVAASCPWYLLLCATWACTVLLAWVATRLAL